MKYTKEIKRVQKMITDLKRIREILTQVEDTVLGIEQEVTDIDNALPDDTDVAAMPDGAEKQQLLQFRIYHQNLRHSKGNNHYLFHPILNSHGIGLHHRIHL